jgi:hypothetical protein
MCGTETRTTIESFQKKKQLNQRLEPDPKQYPSSTNLCMEQELEPI